MFYFCESLTELDVSHWNTNEVVLMESTFAGCKSLKTLDVSHFDTSKVTSMYRMFGGCQQLTQLDVSNFETGLVTDMNLMFNACSGVPSLDVSHWDTSNVSMMQSVFQNCTGLHSLDFSSWDISKASTNNMLQGCSRIDTLTLSSSMVAIDTTACMGVGSLAKPCTVMVPDDFDFGTATDSTYYFKWCKGIFRLPNSCRLGDVNVDGIISLEDVMETVSHILGMQVYNFHSGFADVDENGEITIVDVIMIVNLFLENPGEADAEIVIDDD